MCSFEYQRGIERMFYRHGMFMSNHPTVMILFSAGIILGCCYPLLNLPLPGCEPTEFSTPSSDFISEIYTVGKSLPYEHQTMPKELPPWFETEKQVAYVQQFLIKSVVHPWKENEQVDAVKATLAKVFTFLEVVENFHLEENEDRSIMKQCYHVSESVIKPKKTIKPLFPEYGCLLMSPASFWSKSSQKFQNDPSIVRTIHKYQTKAIQTSPSIKDLLFGVPSRETGIRFSMDTNHQTVVTYAITLILKDYDHKLIAAIKRKLSTLYPTKILHQCKNGSNCENSSDSGGDELKTESVITHVHFKLQIGSTDLVPLLSTNFLMGCYIYFSVRKINFVKSKLGMAFSAVVSIMASLMTSVGVCSLFGLKPILNGGEIFPYLVIFIGLENVLVITKSVVATPIHLDVNKRIALGLSREGCSITKNLLLELILIGLGYFTYIPEIQEFCAFAVVGVLTDSFMHMVFFTSILSIDIRRLDLSEDLYMQTRDSDSEDDDVRCTNMQQNHQGRKKSMLEQLRAATKKRQRKNSDEIHEVETGGKKVTILKIPKRLRVLFFWADTRMFQRGLMVCLLIWCAILMYGDPLGNTRPRPVGEAQNKFKLSTMPPVPTPDPYRLFKKEEKEVTKESFDAKGNLRWKKSDLELYRRLSFRHWPTLFAYYNVTLAGRFVSILPTIPVTIVIPPSEVSKERMTDSDSSKHVPSPSDSPSQDDNMGQQLPRMYYPMNGLDYYLTLLVGAVSGMMMVFFLTVLYRCICTRSYADWHSDGKHHRRTGSAKYRSSIGDTIPLVLAGHPQVVDCIVCDDNLLASTDLSGEIRVWDIHTGTCNCVIRRVSVPPPKRDPAEGAVDAKPTPIGYQENDKFIHNQATPVQRGHTRHKSWHELSAYQNMNQSNSSGVAIPYSSNRVDNTIAAMQSALGSYNPEIDFSFSINTDFESKDNEMESMNRSRRRGATSVASISSLPTENGSINYNYDEGSVGYDFEGILRDSYLSQIAPSTGISSLGSLARYLRMDSLLESPLVRQRNRTVSQPCLMPSSSLAALHDRNLIMPSSQIVVSQLQSELLAGDTLNVLHPPQLQYSPGLTNMSSELLDEMSMMESWGSEIGQMSPHSFPGSQSSSPGSPAEVENGPAVWCMVGLQDFIITGCESGKIEVWDGRSGVLKCAYEGSREGVVGLVAEDKKIVAARVNGPVRTRHTPNYIDDIIMGDLVLCFFNTVKSAHQQPITAFKMAMGRVVTGSCDHTLKVFTIQDAHCLFTLYGHKAPISALFIDKSPLVRAASGSSDGTIRIWDLLSGRCLHMLDDHKAEVTSLQCSDTHIVSIAQDDQLCIWTRAGVLLHVRCLDPGCSADMCLLGSSWCVTGGTGHILLWDLRNGELVRKVKLSGGTSGLTSRVTKLVPVANLAVACDTGKELQIVYFPSVLEKVD